MVSENILEAVLCFLAIVAVILIATAEGSPIRYYIVGLVWAILWYVLLIALSIRSESKVLIVIGIIMTSLVSVFIIVILAILTVAILTGTYLIIFHSNNSIINKEVVSAVLNPDALVFYILKLYKNKHVILLVQLVSVPGQLLVLKSYPIYMYEKIKDVYQVVSIILIVLTSIVLIFDVEIQAFEDKYTHDLLDKSQLGLYHDGSIDEDLVDNFDLVDLLTLIVIPYTLGSVILVFVIDSRIKIFRSRAERILLICIKNKKIELQEKKRILYFGGLEYEKYLQLYPLAFNQSG